MSGGGQSISVIRAGLDQTADSATRDTMIAAARVPRDTRDPALTSTASRMAGIMGRGAEQQLDDRMSHSLVRHLSPPMFGVGHH